MTLQNKRLLLGGVLLSLVALAAWSWSSLLPGLPDPQPTQVEVFDGLRAFSDAEAQVAFGPRLPGSPGQARTAAYIEEELQTAGWLTAVDRYETEWGPVVNLTGYRQVESGSPIILLGAHFDTREFADRDPDADNRGFPVPGANDGASGVAVLLELARVLPADYPLDVRLVFFDAEDNGDIRGQEWAYGSMLYVETLIDTNQPLPDQVVIVDMVGDRDLNIFLDLNSDQELAEEIWGVGAQLGYADYLIDAPRYAMIDDHIAFRNRGVPSVLLIDFDYPYWHTTQDTLDKISPASLQIVGETLLAWLSSRADIELAK
jgi:Zn-dependent M28 family amino/carboxypeptidase